MVNKKEKLFINNPSRYFIIGFKGKKRFFFRVPKARRTKEGRKMYQICIHYSSLREPHHSRRVQ